MWTEEIDGSKYTVNLYDTYFTEVSSESELAGIGGQIIFQHGPIQEFGVNGTTIETVIDVLINRLRGFERGPFSSLYNADAIDYLEKAHERLLDRTRDRLKRGVEGTNVR